MVIAARAVQSWLDVPIGSAESTVAVVQHEFASLLAALLPTPFHASPEASGRDPLLKRPVQDVLDALHALGSTWDGERFDAERLAAAVRERWTYLRALRRPHLIEDRWFRPTRTPEERRRHGALIDASAAAALEDELSKHSIWRHETTYSPARCARALGVSEPLLEKIAVAVGLPGDLSIRAGYLKSQLSRMHVWKQRLFTTAELDEVLGASGVAEALTRIGLLRPFGFGYGHVLGYVPEEVADLYDRIARRLEPRNASQTIGKSVAAAAGHDPSTVARLVAQVHDGQITLLGWERPHRLVDLLVQS